ncbi:MAG: DUF1289 domain-containing protein [Gammaproteobacteria bacterium]|nr:DUF1289 domain-containing protein [Gammaproteobacteria bacterium]
MPETAPRSPCIGVCSTTYGDLICRGCYRFAHEVAQWNGYEPTQQTVVLERLASLRAGAVSRHLSPIHIDQLVRQAASVKLRRTGGRSAPETAYEVLRRLSVWRRPLPWATEDEDAPIQAHVLLGRIDKDIWQRSEAHYERNFRIAAQ